MIREERLMGVAALDRADEPIGEVRQVYVDETTEQPRWACVRVSLLGAEVLVPLDDAAWGEEVLRLAVGWESVVSAPPAEGVDAPTAGQEQRLYSHYGIPSVRLPRDPSKVFEVDAADVSYSVRVEEDAEELIRSER